MELSKSIGLFPFVPVITTSAPSFEYSSAIALPIPLVAPVIKTFFSLKLLFYRLILILYILVILCVHHLEKILLNHFLEVKILMYYLLIINY